MPADEPPFRFYDMVERVSPGPYLDVFSRRARLGWTTWGDQALHGTNVLVPDIAPDNPDPP